MVPRCPEPRRAAFPVISLKSYATSRGTTRNRPFLACPYGGASRLCHPRASWAASEACNAQLKNCGIAGLQGAR